LKRIAILAEASVVVGRGSLAGPVRMMRMCKIASIESIEH
jgi:hypothetical protein